MLFLLMRSPQQKFNLNTDQNKQINKYSRGQTSYQRKIRKKNCYFLNDKNLAIKKNDFF